MLLPRLWTWQSMLNCEMLSSPDTLPVLFVGFAGVVKMTNHTGLWDAELAWYSPSATCWICWGCEDDEPHWTVRCRACLILSKCYLLDLLGLWSWRTTLDCEKLSSPDILQVLLAGFTTMTWCTALESTVFGLFNLAWLSRFLQPKQNYLNHLVT